MRRSSHHLQQLMASSSSFSITRKLEHDVFLSFYGGDIGRNFVSHLCEALSEKNIKTFIDDNLYRGEEISPSVLKAIEHSKISVIIFSIRYASRWWCLEELEEIVKCKNTYDQIVIPVFYEVDPSDVRNRSGYFGKQFALLEKRFMDDSEKLQGWRSALWVAANLSGYDSKNFSDEAELIEEIVKEIMKRLQYKSPKDFRKRLQDTSLKCLAKVEVHEWDSESESQGWRFLSVFFLVMEAISVVLDVYGKSKKNFLLAAFVLSAFGFIITIYAFIRKRRTAAYRQKPVRELAWVEVAFSVLQLVTLFIQYILTVARVKNSYSLPLFPLVFALLVVVFAFKKQQISHSQVPI